MKLALPNPSLVIVFYPTVQNIRIFTELQFPGDVNETLKIEMCAGSGPKIWRLDL